MSSGWPKCWVGLGVIADNLINIAHTSSNKSGGAALVLPRCNEPASRRDRRLCGAGRACQGSRLAAHPGGHPCPGPALRDRHRPRRRAHRSNGFWPLQTLIEASFMHANATLSLTQNRQSPAKHHGDDLQRRRHLAGFRRCKRGATRFHGEAERPVPQLMS
jgi:hypothetical protein